LSVTWENALPDDKFQRPVKKFHLAVIFR